ncbi:arginine--tRNA ligase domain-containing protein [Nocardia fluminea]|uniref:arginine--tRNA ligase domain-containing protein n=1 Tax=Nocardia fluminea TaxID=134984 RepID=UPI00379BC5AE
MNITLPDSVVWKTVAARLADDLLGIATSEVGQRVLIDYSAPDVAREMHVGRQTVIVDDSLARVFGFLGADVVPANHVCDWWTQFGMLIQYIDEHPEFALYTEELDARTSSVSALDSQYTAARAQFDAEPSFADRARTRVVVLQAGTRHGRAVAGDHCRVRAGQGLRMISRRVSARSSTPTCRPPGSRSTSSIRTG